MIQVKDKLASWYVQKFILSKAQIFDSPGFVAFKINGKSSFYSRQLILPEELFVNLELMIDKEFGEKGKQILYSLGKKFGYRFSLVGNLETFQNFGGSDFNNYVYSVVRFVEGTYSSGLSHIIDVKDKLFELKMNNFIICSKSGSGMFLSQGGIAGIWSKLTGNLNVEAVHPFCQGKGDSECVVFAADKKILEEKGYKLFYENELDELEIDKDYVGLNSVQPIQNSTTSFQTFLNSNLFSYHNGIILMGSDRFFVIESSIIYLIEKECSKDLNILNSFAKLSFNLGGKLFDGKNIQYLINFLSAMGFGDPFILKKGEGFLVNFDFFPWTRFAKDTNHVFLKSFISGALSKIFSEEINLNVTFKGFNGKGYTITLS